MSIRAYKVIKMELEENPTLNLWHDERIIDLIDKNNDWNLLNTLNQDNNGLISIQVKALREVLNNSEEL